MGKNIGSFLWKISTRKECINVYGLLCMYFSIHGFCSVFCGLFVITITYENCVQEIHVAKKFKLAIITD